MFLLYKSYCGLCLFTVVEPLRHPALPSADMLPHISSASGEILGTSCCIYPTPKLLNDFFPGMLSWKEYRDHPTWPEGRNSWEERSCAQTIGKTCGEEQPDIPWLPSDIEIKSMTVGWAYLAPMQKGQWILHFLILSLNPCPWKDGILTWIFFIFKYFNFCGDRTHQSYLFSWMNLIICTHLGSHPRKSPYALSLWGNPSSHATQYSKATSILICNTSVGIDLFLSFREVELHLLSSWALSKVVSFGTVLVPVETPFHEFKDLLNKKKRWTQY